MAVRNSDADPFAQPVMSRDGSTFAWIGANRAVLVGQVGEVPVAVGVACPLSRPDCSRGPALTASGRSVFYFVGYSEGSIPDHLERFDLDTSARTTFPELRPSEGPRPIVSGDGHFVVVSDSVTVVLDTATRRVETLSVSEFFQSAAISDDGLTVLSTTPPFGYFDRRLSMSFAVAEGLAKAISANGRYMAGVRWDGVFMVLDLDGDGDGMSDRGRRSSGFRQGDPTDGPGDADGDGRPNLLEYREGTHPRGIYQRHFAEGVSRADFQTRVHVFDAPATVSGERWPPTVISFLSATMDREGRVP